MDVLMQERTGVRIGAIVARMLAKRGAATDVAPDRNLRDAGLTSLDMVNLMLAIEGDFDIFIPQDEMTPENFRSIDAIQALVATLIPGA